MKAPWWVRFYMYLVTATLAAMLVMVLGGRDSIQGCVLFLVLAFFISWKEV